jgi:MoaA/NifB/PqqE/SkfB family radical SAM enzyme
VKLDRLTYFGEAAAAVLLSNQIEGIRRLIALGVVVKVNTVLISGVNDHHVEEVSRFMAELGVSFHNIMQMVPVQGSVFGDLPQVSRHVLDEVRAQCAQHLPQMRHCQQCRADAVGKLSEDLLHIIEGDEGIRKVRPPHASSKVITVVPPGDNDNGDKRDGTILSPVGASGKKEEVVAKSYHPSCSDHRPMGKLRVAVASRSGMMVDTHFGHAKDFLVYEVDGLSLRYLERRNTDTYCKGSDYCADDERENRLNQTIATVRDCRAVVCLRIGHAPSQKLRDQGIHPLTSCDSIEAAVREAQQFLVNESRKAAKAQATDSGLNGLTDSKEVCSS